MSPTAQPVSTADSPFSQRQLWGWAAFFGVLSILIHLPFLFRFDLYFQSGIAVGVLECKRMLLGELPIYCWGTDYAGLSPFMVLTAALYKIFDFSIPLAGLSALIAWASGITLLVGYVGLCFGKRAALASGCALAVGVPHMTLYSTQSLYSYSEIPLLLGGFIWLTYLFVQRGPQSKLGIGIGLLMGYYWYVQKQVLIVWLAIGVALILLPQGRKFLKEFFGSRGVLLAALGFIVGYSPELLYKLGFFDHTGRSTDTTGFFHLATPANIAQNWYMVLRCIPTYFDADPWSRSVAGVHYLNHLENWESFPLNPSDTVGIVAAFLVIPFGLNTAIRSYREKNLKIFLLMVVPLVDVAMILVSATADHSYYKIRRYLMPSGIILLVWMGMRFAEDFRLRHWLNCGVLGLLLVISAAHQLELVESPDDELGDYRKTVAEIEKSGYKFGLTWFSFAHTLTALSNERVVFGILDHTMQSPYQQTVLEQNIVAVVWPAVQPPPFEFAQKMLFGKIAFRQDTVQTLPATVSLLGTGYQRISEPRIVGELGWAPYRRLATMTTPPPSKP